MAVRKRRVFAVADKKHQLHVGDEFFEHLICLYFLEIERAFERMLWQNFLINV